MSEDATLEAMMAPGFAERFAKEWVAAWNAHDLDRVFSHYDDDFEMSSPIISSLVGEASGTLRGKPAVRAFWAGHRGLVAEVFHFGASGKVSKVFAHYAEWQA